MHVKNGDRHDSRLLEKSIMAITFSNMKGGIGKSTDAILLANNFAARGKKVPFFDMDTNKPHAVFSSCRQGFQKCGVSNVSHER